ERGERVTALVRVAFAAHQRVERLAVERGQFAEVEGREFGTCDEFHRFLRSFGGPDHRSLSAPPTSFVNEKAPLVREGRSNRKRKKRKRNEDAFRYARDGGKGGIDDKVAPIPLDLARGLASVPASGFGSAPHPALARSFRRRGEADAYRPRALRALRGDAH